jgi:hypothetical protein
LKTFSEKCFLKAFSPYFLKAFSQSTALKLGQGLAKEVGWLVDEFKDKFET